MGLGDRIVHAWNAFKGETTYNFDIGPGSSRQNMYPTTSRVTSRTLAGTIFNRIAVDCSMVSINHVILNPKTLNEKIVDDGIQNCLSVEANLDQSHLAFLQDLVYSMFDEGAIAVVPVDTDINPNISGSFDIRTLRVGKIIQWYPKHVVVNLYDQNTGNIKPVKVEKAKTAIIENPLYAVTNGGNSTLRRLIDKMALQDVQDKMDANGKMDLILQFPYLVRNDIQKSRAADRLKSIETQLTGSKYGIAYVDSTEKITQLNRSVTNGLVDQINTLKQELYDQLGLTENIFKGTASEAEMRVYYSRTIDPIIAFIASEFKRKFLTKTARTLGHTFTYRRDQFNIIPAESLASMSDTFTRNAILSSNEVRNILGFPPSNDPDADKLINRNISEKNQIGQGSVASPDDSQNGYNTSEGSNE